MSAIPEPAELSPYSPMWPAVFDIERERLTRVFGADRVAIEHIGSTAVPGLGGKPIIDVMLGAPDLAIVDRHIPELVAQGYRHVPEVERGTRERRFLVKAEGHPGYFHLHAVGLDTASWRDHLAFRDALRADAALAGEYWRLKRRILARYPTDRAAYNDAKSTFIRTVVEASR
jgi:GrpB-like predicted nucleotidyltransferase (UPF0157 family)